MSVPVAANDDVGKIRHFRGISVIVDADLAAALGMDTKRFNERVKKNADLLDDRHRFQLTRAEFDNLRSQDPTSRLQHGGRRYEPWVFTERGVARVVTFINTPQALRAADLIIDTFLMVQKQIAAGQREITVTDPMRYHADPAIVQQSNALRTQIMSALSDLVKMVIDIRTGASVGDTAKDMTARFLENVRERLREKGLENLKLEAEIQLVLQEAEKVAQEVEGKKLENLEKRIDLVQKLWRMQQEMGPVQVVQLMHQFDASLRIDAAQPARLPPPAAAGHVDGDVD